MGETKGRNGSLSKIFETFADLVLDLQGKRFGAAEKRRKPQETAENRRKQFRPLSPI